MSADDAAKARREVNARGAAQAREKLAQAKADAARRGRLPRSEPRRARPGGSAAGRAPRVRRPAAVRPGDPRSCSPPAAGSGEAAVGGVFGRWAEIVGPELAAHTRPVSFADGEVTVAADSTAWATQVRLLAGVLVRRLNEELGDGTVTRVRVHGPQGAAAPRAACAVPGRGPRDTYG